MIVEPTTREGMEPEQIDEFATLLLDTLYALSRYVNTGLMPVSLSAKPASFEKYPQILFNLLEINRRERDVEGAFTNWRSQVLRKLDYLDIAPDAYQKLERLHAWMVDGEHADAFYDKTTLRHLRKSMFGRTFAYLYPRLALIMEYATYCKERDLLTELVPGGTRLRAVADPVFIARHFAEGTPIAQLRIEETLGASRIPALLVGAQEFLLGQQAYFERVFRTKKAEKEDGK